MPSLPPQTHVVPRSFYDRSPELVARDLLGKILTHRYEGEVLSGRIIETEAYLGVEDPASHAAVGRTDRNAVLFGPPGFAYIYFIYGMHFCLNVSCLSEGEPGGVLFRALMPIDGLATMKRLRGLPEAATPKQIAGGPGRLCEALGITRTARNGTDLTVPSSPLRIVDDGLPVTAIQVTPRIGIQKAAERPLRFFIEPGPQHTEARPKTKPSVRRNSAAAEQSPESDLGNGS